MLSRVSCGDADNDMKVIGLGGGWDSSQHLAEVFTTMDEQASIGRIESI